MAVKGMMPLVKSQEKIKSPIIYDALYGFIHLTPVEWEIIHTPFYQRLRWIKQLGFSFYTFPGAEHSRFGHSIGVMYNAHCILKSVGHAVSDKELFSGNLSSEEARYHQKIRLAALLHDIGTFPFSHTTEMSYIRYAETKNKKIEGKVSHQDDHEHLGSYILKRTEEEGGIFYILKKYNINPKEVSDLIKGVGKDILANQILHSEIDCDRMDYLLRDAHYTGLQYGTYDRDYLLHHFKVVEVGDQKILAINEKAIYCIQDFLMSRFAWYSQVIRSARGAKFDALAEEIAFKLLVEGKLPRYQELLEMIEHNPMDFYSFSDQYFVTTIQHLHKKGKFNDPSMKNMIEHLLLSRSPKTLKLDVFKQRILEQDNSGENHKYLKRANDKLQEIAEYIQRHGNPKKDWILNDMPKKDVVLVKSRNKIVKDKLTQNVLLERDPAKILLEDGNVTLLSSYEDSLINKLQNTYNFMPNVFCSESAYDLLARSGILEG